MDLPNTQDLIELSDQRGGHRISIFAPAHRNGIRLGNLLRRAEQALLDDGAPAADVELALSPARRLPEQTRRCGGTDDGLALFCQPGGMRQLSVPLRLPELVAVGDRFLVRPLLPLLNSASHFYVLALGQDDLRLFRGSRHGLEQMVLDGLPLAMWLTMPRRRARVNAFAADRGGTAVNDDQTPVILQHFRRVDQALREILRAGDVPLLLAGVRSAQALYRQVNTHPGLIPDGVDSDPGGLRLDHLHRVAWSLAEPALQANEITYRQLRGRGRACTDAMAVCAAAEQGRIETLFVRTDALTGPSDVVRLYGNTPEPDPRDFAAVSTLRHGGTVYAVTRDRMPDTSPLAAVLRY